VVSIFSWQFYLLLEGAHPSESLTIKSKHIAEESKKCSNPRRNEIGGLLLKKLYNFRGYVYVFGNF